MGYARITPFPGDGVSGEELLGAIPAVDESDLIRHVRFDRPLYIFVDGRNNKAIVKR